MVLLFSPHVSGAGRDLYTAQIVEEAALLSKSWAIIAKGNKHFEGADEDSAKSDLDGSVRDFVTENGVKCIIMIGGRREPGITVKNELEGPKTEEVVELIRSGLEPHFSVKAVMDQSRGGLSGSGSDDQRVDGSSDHSIHLIRIELGPEERGFQKDQFVNCVADIVGLINAKLGFSESGSGVLD